MREGEKERRIKKGLVGGLLFFCKKKPSAIRLKLSINFN